MKLEIHHHHHYPGLEDLAGMLRAVLRNLETIMATLDEVLADVEAESTTIDSLSTLLSGLKQQLDDALSGAKLPPAVQAKVDKIFDAAEKNKQKIADAVAANTPASEPPTNG